MSRPDPVYKVAETIKRYKLPLEVGWIRIWREASGYVLWNFPNPELDEDVVEIVRKFARRYDHGWQQEMLKELCLVPGVTIVELTDQQGCGVVLYVIWP